MTIKTTGRSFLLTKFEKIRKEVILNRQRQRAAFVEANTFVLKTLSENERYDYLYFGYQLQEIEDLDKCLREISQQTTVEKKLVSISESKVIKDWISSDQPLFASKN